MTESEKAKRYRATKIGRAKSLIYGYRREDRKYNRGECELTEQQLINLWNNGCFWCGETDWHKLGAHRIDNSKPHTIDNVVCSCWTCNNMRYSVGRKVKIKKEKKETIYNRKPVVQYTIEGQFIAEYPSASEAERQTKITTITKCCRGIQKKAGGYVWKWKKKC